MNKNDNVIVWAKYSNGNAIRSDDNRLWKNCIMKSFKTYFSQKKMSAKKIEEICPNLMENNTHNQWITVIREKSVKVILLCVMRIN